MSISGTWRIAGPNHEFVGKSKQTPAKQRQASYQVFFAQLQILAGPAHSRVTPAEALPVTLRYGAVCELAFETQCGKGCPATAALGATAAGTSDRIESSDSVLAASVQHLGLHAMHVVNSTLAAVTAWALS